MDYQKNQQILAHEEEDDNNSQLQVSELSQILEESRKNTLKFIEELKEKALTPISQEVLDHYNGQIKSNYLTKDIICILDKRISKMIRNKKIKKNWNFDDIVLLLWFVSKYLSQNQNLTCETFQNQDWKFISKLIPGSTPKGCMFKFISLKKVKLSLFNWSQEEEDMLKSLVKKFGQNRWKEISQYLYEHNPTSKIFRTPKQCREHWNCYLDPRLKKGPWSESEDIRLIQNISSNKGERKWSLIKHLFQGRTQNALKNRYNLLIERQKKFSPQKNQSELIKQYLRNKGVSQTSINLQPSQEILCESQDPEDQIAFIQDSNSIPIQMFAQEVNEDSKNKTLITVDQVQKPFQPLIQSAKSSFRLSQAYEKSLMQKKMVQNKINFSEQNKIENLMLMNLCTYASIYTNQQGFYTNLAFKPYYQP